MADVLITGGAGFIGSHLALRLAESGHSVELLDNFSRGVRDSALSRLAREPRVSLTERDLLVRGSLDHLPADYRYIYHLAAIVGVANVLGRPYAVLADNVAMLGSVIDLARRQKNLARLVFASTSEVYAGLLQHFTLPIPTPETVPLALPDLHHPRTSYMLSKIYGEAMCHHSGVPFTIIRPHNVYGPRMGLSHVIPELLQKAHRARDGDSLPVSSVDHRRTFCYVDDAAALVRAVAESARGEGQTLNIGNQEPEVTIGEVADIVVRTVGKRLTILPQPATPGSPSRRCPDIERTVAIAGFRPEVSLAEGIARTYQWYRAHVFEGGEASAR